jgi:hypothetical protein
MANGKRSPPQSLALLSEEEETQDPSPLAPKRQATSLNRCLDDYVEAVSPAFDPKRVLLRRIFFINQDKTKYVSIGYYPARNYEPLVEFGGSVRINPIILTEPQVRFLAESIPDMCISMCNGQQTTFKNANVRLATTGNLDVARLYLGSHYVSIRLEELR